MGEWWAWVRDYYAAWEIDSTGQFRTFEVAKFIIATGLLLTLVGAPVVFVVSVLTRVGLVVLTGVDALRARQRRRRR